jgi:taurine transport system substrate-binding protein
MHHIRRTSIIAIAALLAVTGLAACGDSGEDASTTTAGSGDAASAPETITIAYQAIPNGDLIVKSEGWLEEALPDTEIEWKLFDSGGSVNEAAIAGSIDFGLAGSSPVSRGLSQPIPYQVPWIHDVIGAAEALVVKDGIESIADLEGKKVATPFASTAHFSLLAALEDAGVDPAKVDIIDAEPDDIYAAWTRGDIDGAYVWNPNLAKLKDEGGTVLIDSAQLSEKGATTYDLAVVTDEFAEQYPDVVDIWAEAQNRAVTLIKENPSEAASIIATELNITPEEAEAQLGDLIFLDASEQVGPDYLGGGLAENLIAAAEFNKEQGQIDEVQPDSVYQDAVVTRFAESAAQT